MRGRFVIYTILLIFLFGAIVVRLFYWQIIRGKDLSQIARSQYQRSDLKSAPRGDILASDESWLVTNKKVYTVFSEPEKITKSLDEISEKLAEVFVKEMELTEDDDSHMVLLDEVNRLKTVVNKQDAMWVPLQDKVSRESKETIETFGISGIGFDPILIRSYPEASTAAHLVGFVGKNDTGENIGYFGLEGYYDLILTGKPGVLSEERDAAGRSLAIGDFSESLAISGADLVTHVDKYIQLTIEEKLNDAMEKYGAKEGSVTVLNPQTGGIVAMAAVPAYDPEKYDQYGDKYFRNPVVSDSFEPGSIFKVIVMASALDAKVVEPDTECNICTGPYGIDKYSISTWDGNYFPNSTMTDVIKHSDNVGMVFVANKLGKEKMYDYLDGFGLGKLTEIDLQGEFAPKLREKDDWSNVDLAITSFGQGVSVTPIQMLSAVSVLANDGLYVRPKVVKTIRGNGWEQEIGFGASRRVISKKAADEITLMMVEAARSGESKWTHREGFGVAGKTGTAQIPIAGKYDEEKTIASFVGFAPHDDPKFVMLVTLREPESSPWASETAAPLWYSIANDLFAHYRMQPKS
ncbi:peptidoglycan D,D-transpeptidase FtsI family protein [Patescibacteria group bacterium]